MGPGRAAIISGGPPTTPTPTGGRPLDPERPDPDPARQSTGTPRGLGAQIQATREALARFVAAHIELARAEVGEIAGEVARAAALGGLAFVSLLFVAFLVLIGVLLFLGEWLFGSLGWGVLIGTLLLIAVAVYAVLIAVRCAHLGRAVAIAFAIGLVFAVVFGSNVLAIAYRTIADGFGSIGDPGDISFLFGAAIGAVVAGIVGLILGARSGAASGAIGGLVSGAIFGALVGVLVTGIVRLGINPATRPMIVGMVIWAVIVAVVAAIATARYGWRTALGVGGAALIGGGLFGMFSAITFGWPVAIAIGLSVWLGFATGIAVAYAANGGIDLEALKARYWPQTTIDTAKETMEWARDRIPGMKA